MIENKLIFLLYGLAAISGFPSVKSGKRNLIQLFLSADPKHLFSRHLFLVQQHGENTKLSNIFSCRVIGNMFLYVYYSTF